LISHVRTVFEVVAPSVVEAYWRVLCQTVIALEEALARFFQNRLVGHWCLDWGFDEVNQGRSSGFDLLVSDSLHLRVESNYKKTGKSRGRLSGDA
jgi:hypothetical protein